MSAWYTLQTVPKREHLAAAALRREARLEVFCPRLRSRKATRRGAVQFTEALFPGYLFARFDFATAHRQVRATHGVSSIVSFGEDFPVLPEAALANLQASFPEDEILDLGGLDEPRPGDTIDVLEGPFAGLQAVVQRVLPARQRVTILIDLLGRVVETELDCTAMALPRADLQRQAALAAAA